MIHITIAAANDCFHHQLILGTLSSFRDLGFLYINLFLYSFNVTPLSLLQNMVLPF